MAVCLGEVADLAGERTWAASSRTRGEAADLVKAEEEAIFLVKVLVDRVSLSLTSVSEAVLTFTLDLVTLLAA